MKVLDKYYLELQFKIKIYSKDATEFQSLFENIMEKTFTDFKKIPSGGGDGGNDGWIRKIGRYYQVYAPQVPSTKDSDAAKKLKADFIKLKNEWNDITEIKEYYFVFNDKYYGSKKTEKAIAELKIKNPNIEFRILLAIDIERAFFELNEADILSIGFNIDSRQVIENAYLYLDFVKIALDKGLSKDAHKILENNRHICMNINDERLSIEFELLECRCLQKLEKVHEAKKGYLSIIKRFPKELKALLFLAEIYLNEKNYGKNKFYLDKASQSDSEYWLLVFGKIIRDIQLKKNIDINKIERIKIPSDSKIKSSFYNLFALININRDIEKANSYIEKSIHLYPDRYTQYLIKLSILDSILISNKENSDVFKQANNLLKKIEETKNKFIENGNIDKRTLVVLNTLKINSLLLQENYSELEQVVLEIIDSAKLCYFDFQIEMILSRILTFVQLSNNRLDLLLEYLKTSKIEISDNLIKKLILQFAINKKLLTTGKSFFKSINNNKYLNFINNVESNNHAFVLDFIADDIEFAIGIANTFKNHTSLRKKIIDNLPNDKNIQKDKLYLLLNFDKKDYNHAYDLLNNLDLTNLHYIECKPIFDIIHRKEAWEFEIIILNKLIGKEKNADEKLIQKLLLFNAYFNLKNYNEVVKLGEEILKEEFKGNNINLQNKEAILSNTIQACFERSVVDKSMISKSKKIIEKYILHEPTYEFKIGIEAEVYIKNNDEFKALSVVIEGVKIKKILSSNDYAKLYFILNIKIAGIIGLSLDSLKTVENNNFVKLKNIDQWYYVGNNSELDARKITKKDTKYRDFINKNIGDKFFSENRYSSKDIESEIEIIYSIEKYLLFHVLNNFQNLAKDGDLKGVQIIEVLKSDHTFEDKNIIQYFKDSQKRTEPFFEEYCKNNIPLSMLALNEGGIINAIGLIQNKKKGFINFSNGSIEDFERQKEIARKIIQEELAFYLDGTSAIFLAEIGIFQKIYSYIPNMKTPQSVIGLLTNLAERFDYKKHQAGYLVYNQGKIMINNIDEEKSKLLQKNITSTISHIELKPRNIASISLANKRECLSEKRMISELCDATILSQKEKLPILTEDYLYLSLNKIDTDKTSPEYFSSLALIRVLYEDKKISFNEYLDYFNYLSSYRFRFLSINLNDIKKAVYGDATIKIVRPENIKKFNFQLTLSEEYGVLFEKSFSLLSSFLIEMLRDNSITEETSERIFIEVIESFPTNTSKKELAYMFLKTCINMINNIKVKSINKNTSLLIEKKISKLKNIAEIYTSSKLWIPKNK